MRNRTIENPVIKDRITFIRTSDETDGEVTEIIVDLYPGGGNQPHYHTTFAESFTPLDGPLGVLVDKERRTLAPGQTATVQPGVVHCFFSVSDSVVRFHGEARPGRRGLEQFAQIAYGLARNGQVDKKGYPNRLAHIPVLMEMGDVRLPGPVFKLLAPLLAWMARRARA